MSEVDTIRGLKRELKTARKKASDMKVQSIAWRSLAETMRDLLGLDDEKFGNLARSKGLLLD
jgi:hypothetical protein